MRSHVLLVLSVLSVLPACSRTPAPVAPPADVLAQVGTETITVADFQAALAKRRALHADAKGRREVLDELIRFRAEVQEARRRGYDRDPEIVATLERALATKVRENARRQRETELEVTPAEIEERYTANHEKYRIPPRLRVAQIVIEAPSEKRAAAHGALLEACAQAAELPPGSGFGALAARLSFDQKSKFRGGDLGYFTEATVPPEWPQAVQEAALALQRPGEVSEILETPQGYVLLRLMERSAAGDRPGAQVHAEIRAEIRREKEKRLDAALAAATLEGRPVRIDEARWQSLPTPARAAALAPGSAGIPAGME